MSTSTPDVIRIGNCSAFYGDRLSAFEEMLTGGDLDVLTGDYLAELTMLILGRDKLKDADTGYAKTFLRQMESSMGTALDRNTKIVVNAGGVNPEGLGEALHKVAAELGLSPKIGVVYGDDVMDRAEDLGVHDALTANAYLGGWGIAECLAAGSDIVVTGRVTDASLVVGPAAWRFDWQRDDFDKLAGAIAAGHIIECGTQATGGNFSFFDEIEDMTSPGYPIAEVRADGSCIITKHDGTGGAVTVETVTAQLLYEVGNARYANPDATLRLDSIKLRQDGKDRVEVSGVRGEAPPPTYKVCANIIGGHRNEMSFILTGLNIDAKAELIKNQFEAHLQKRPAEMSWTLARTDHSDSASEEEASAFLHLDARDPDPKLIGRSFSNTGVEIALASIPGFHTTAPPQGSQPYGVLVPATIPATEIEHQALLPDGTTKIIEPTTTTLELVDVPDDYSAPPLSDQPTTRAALGTIAGARSGDKGGSANVGVWVRREEAWPWLAQTLTVDKVRELLPEAADLTIRRQPLPNLNAVNFVIEGILGLGVAQKARFDAQAKAIGEWLRSRVVDIPDSLL
ncbi:uncharacterized protein DUF1446 [Antricoccus suffuscus]|uniref:Uncharacterized protein DUF1446 n=1 Tax=Antricoccus suffuscus TaxID=1629062 RepID=A0A2T0ZXA8_9ACTN|nr:acyclic terpene utilization AtuA family protein [Antricoccus suffuscus]PRZ40718.1 uncharacterized protein DUF1446 [Antricoccus suffuscus]